MFRIEIGFSGSMFDFCYMYRIAGFKLNCDSTEVSHIGSDFVKNGDASAPLMIKPSDIGVPVVPHKS